MVPWVNKIHELWCVTCTSFTLLFELFTHKQNNFVFLATRDGNKSVPDLLLSFLQALAFTIGPALGPAQSFKDGHERCGQKFGHAMEFTGNEFLKKLMCFRQFWLNIDFQYTILMRIFVRVQRFCQICNTSSHVSVSASRSFPHLPP